MYILVNDGETLAPIKAPQTWRTYSLLRGKKKKKKCIEKFVSINKNVIQLSTISA